MIQDGYIVWDTEDEHVFIFTKAGVLLYRRDGADLKHTAFIRHGTFARVVQNYSHWLIHGSRVISRQITELDKGEEPEEEEHGPVEHRTRNTLSDDIEAAIDMILSVVPSRKGRPPVRAIRRYVLAVVKNGYAVPSSKLYDRDVKLLTKWNVVTLKGSEGGYYLEPTPKVKEILNATVLGGE